jgi:hypothetical protein
MTNQDHEPGRTTPSGAFSAAAKHAQHAMDGAKEMVAGTDFDQLRTKAPAFGRPRSHVTTLLLIRS